MSFRSVNDSANGSTEKVTVLFDFGLAVEEPHIDEKLSAMRASLRSVQRRICSESEAREAVRVWEREGGEPFEMLLHGSTY